MGKQTSQFRATHRPMEKREIRRKVKAGKAFRGGVLLYAAQGEPQANAEIASKIRFSAGCYGFSSARISGFSSSSASRV